MSISDLFPFTCDLCHKSTAQHLIKYHIMKEIIKNGKTYYMTGYDQEELVAFIDKTLQNDFLFEY